MRDYLINVNYTIEGGTVTKRGVFAVKANSREEAINLTQPEAEKLVARMNGVLVSIT